MIEKIIYKNKLFALIVRGKYRNKKGINFFTSKEATQQFGYMKHKKGHIIQPHQHRKRLTKIVTTTEVILLLKGSLKIDFYTEQRKYLFSRILNEKDIVMLVEGGHGFKVIKDVEMLEVKQGPYNLIKDKVKFAGIYDKRNKIKKR